VRSPPPNPRAARIRPPSLPRSLALPLRRASSGLSTGRRLARSLEAARGNGTSMISLIIRPKDEVSRAQRMLTEEYGTASNIKSRVNRLSVLSAITSTQERLKHYSRVPKNGLVVYCGTVMTDEGKERKVTFDFEPFKPINTSLYLCDNKFHTEALKDLLSDDKKFGFIVMDGHGW
jgi:peptide chain release factor subunit 1